MMDDKVFCEAMLDEVLAPGTKELAMRCLMLIVRPKPPEIRAAARIFGADWRAACVLVGWAETPEGEWLDIFGEGFTWDQVRPEVKTPRAVGGNSQWWNQELAAFALRRTLVNL